MVMLESNHWLGKNIVLSTGKKKLQESIDSCIGRRDKTEIRLKGNAFNSPLSEHGQDSLYSRSKN